MPIILLNSTFMFSKVCLSHGFCAKESRMNHPAINSACNGERCCYSIAFKGDARTVNVFFVTNDDTFSETTLTNALSIFELIPSHDERFTSSR